MSKAERTRAAKFGDYLAALVRLRLAYVQNRSCVAVDAAG